MTNTSNCPQKIQQTVMDIHLFVKLLDQVCNRMERLGLNLSLEPGNLGLLVRQKNILVFFDTLLDEAKELTESLDKIIQIEKTED